MTAILIEFAPILLGIIGIYVILSGITALLESHRAYRITRRANRW